MDMVQDPKVAEIANKERRGAQSRILKKDRTEGM